MAKKQNKKTKKNYPLDFSEITPKMQIKKPEHSEIYEKNFHRTTDENSHSHSPVTWE